MSGTFVPETQSYKCKNDLCNVIEFSENWVESIQELDSREGGVG